MKKYWGNRTWHVPFAHVDPQSQAHLLDQGSLGGLVHPTLHLDREDRLGPVDPDILVYQRDRLRQFGQLHFRVRRSNHRVRRSHRSLPSELVHQHPLFSQEARVDQQVLTSQWISNWGADQRKHLSSASLAFVWGIHRSPVNSPHKGPVTRKMFLFDNVIMKWYGCFDITYIWYSYINKCYLKLN